MLQIRFIATYALRLGVISFNIAFFLFLIVAYQYLLWVNPSVFGYSDATTENSIAISYEQRALRSGQQILGIRDGASQLGMQEDHAGSVEGFVRSNTGQVSVALFIISVIFGSVAIYFFVAAQAEHISKPVSLNNSKNNR